GRRPAGSPTAARSTAGRPWPGGGTRASGPPSRPASRSRARGGPPQRRVRPPRRTPRARLCRRRHAPRTPRARARGIARGAPRRACAGPSPPRGSVEVALQLVEKALGPAVRVLVARTLELAEQPALRLV